MTSEELKLLRSFPGSVVNSKGMFVPEPDDIAGFSLMEEWMGPEIKCRVLERLCWAAAFAMPYGDRQKDRELREFYRKGINTYLGTEFSRDDLKLVCKKLGNAIDHGLTLRFVMHGYDLTLLEENRW